MVVAPPDLKAPQVEPAPPTPDAASAEKASDLEEVHKKKVKGYWDDDGKPDEPMPAASAPSIADDKKSVEVGEGVDESGTPAAVALDTSVTVGLAARVAADHLDDAKVYSKQRMIQTG